MSFMWENYGSEYIHTIFNISKAYWWFLTVWGLALALCFLEQSNNVCNYHEISTNVFDIRWTLRMKLYAILLRDMEGNIKNLAHCWSSLSGGKDILPMMIFKGRTKKVFINLLFLISRQLSRIWFTHGYREEEEKKPQNRIFTS
jgi:hypothetical protein